MKYRELKKYLDSAQDSHPILTTKFLQQRYYSLNNAFSEETKFPPIKKNEVEGLYTKYLKKYESNQQLRELTGELHFFLLDPETKPVDKSKILHFITSIQSQLNQLFDDKPQQKAYEKKSKQLESLITATLNKIFDQVLEEEPYITFQRKYKAYCIKHNLPQL